MSDCIFCKIISGEIPSEKVYEDELCLGFLDVSPLAPTHILMVPKAHCASANEIDEQNEAVIGHIFKVVAQLAREKGFSGAFRVVANCGADAGQTVGHLHFHVLAGKAMGSFN